jgi:hypothetical protein
LIEKENYEIEEKDKAEKKGRKAQVCVWTELGLKRVFPLIIIIYRKKLTKYHHPKPPTQPTGENWMMIRVYLWKKDKSKVLKTPLRISIFLQPIFSTDKCPR